MGVAYRAHDFLERKDRHSEIFGIAPLHGIDYRRNVVYGYGLSLRLPIQLRLASRGLQPRLAASGSVLMGENLASLLVQTDFPLFGRDLFLDLGNDLSDQRVAIDIP